MAHSRIRCLISVNFIALTLLICSREGNTLTEAECENFVFRPVVPQGTPTTLKKPRIFPICVLKKRDGTWDPNVNTEWQRIILDIYEDNPPPTTYDPALHHSSDRNQYAVSFLVATVAKKAGFFSQQQKCDRRLALQFTLNGNPNIRGIYLQAVKGPLGVPFGEFRIEPRLQKKGGGCIFGICNPDDSTDEIKRDWQTTGHLDGGKARYVRCTYLPNANNGQRQQGAFLYTDTNGIGRSLFQLQFRWDDTFCSEASFFQFIMIIVEDFGTPLKYKAMLTDVFKLGPLNLPTLRGDSTDDSPNDELTVKAVAPVQMGGGDAKIRIIPNLDYENCIHHGIAASGAERELCPPGPFTCSRQNLGSSNYHEDEWTKSKATYSQFDPNKGSCAPPPPTTTTTTTTTTTPPPPPPPVLPPFVPPPPPPPPPPTKVDNLTKKTEQVAHKSEQRKVISHSELAMYTWFVLMPSVNYFARYFKEFRNITGLSLGYWIMIHIVGHHLSVLLMWISFGMVLSNGHEFFGSSDVGHFWFGLVATVGQHYLIFESVVGEITAKADSGVGLKDKPAFHVVIGHFAHLSALICTYYAQQTSRHFAEAITAVNILALIIGGVIDRRMDKYLGVYPARRWFPELERIVLEDEEGTNNPFTKYKIIFLLIYVCSINIIYVFLVIIK